MLTVKKEKLHIQINVKVFLSDKCPVSDAYLVISLDLYSTFQKLKVHDSSIYDIRSWKNGGFAFGCPQYLSSLHLSGMVA